MEELSILDLAPLSPSLKSLQGPFSPPLNKYWWHQTMGSQYDGEKDASRPFYHRRKGEIGIYLTIYDADAVDAKSYGLRHFFFMQLQDELYQHYSTMDVIGLRGRLFKRGVLDGTCIERFEPGIVLVVTVDDVQSLETLWSLYKIGKLGACVQEALVTPAVLKCTGTTRIHLKTRLWDDEYDACKEELQQPQSAQDDIQDREKDLKLLDTLKTFQKKFTLEVTRMRDLELQMEQNLGDFVLKTKQILPANVTTLKSCKDFETIVKLAKGANAIRKMASIDLYLQIVKKWREVFQELENDVIPSLLQIHSTCESESQRKAKSNIVQTVKDAKEMLKSDNNLKTISHADWSLKITKREKEIFQGLISVIPLGADKASDIDHALDEYFIPFQRQ